MIKHIIAAVALLTSTPVQAQAISVTVERFNLLVEIAPQLCRTARVSGGNMAENIDRLMPTGSTIGERIVMLSMCKTYLHGLVDGINGSY